MKAVTVPARNDKPFEMGSESDTNAKAAKTTKPPTEEVKEEKRLYMFSGQREAVYESIIDIQFTESDVCKLIYSDGKVYIKPSDQECNEDEDYEDLCPKVIRRQDLDFTKEELDAIFNDLYDAVNSDQDESDKDLAMNIKNPELREKFLRH